MPKFQVCITRDLSESAFVEIEAEDEDEAVTQAMAKPDLTFTLDDGNIPHLYVSDVNRITRYNHAVTLAFEVISDDPEGKDISPAMLRAALQRRIKDLDQGNIWEEACLPPYDTFEEQP